MFTTRNTNHSSNQTAATSNYTATSRNQNHFGINGLTFYYQNLGGMNTSIADYSLACSDEAYDLYAFTETWLNCNTLSTQIFGRVYSVFRADRSNQTSSKNSGGGVLLAVRSSYKCLLLQPPECPSVEQIWVELFVPGFRIFICVIYVPPDRVSDTTLLSQHSESLSWITSRMSLDDKILIMGDFNMRSVNWIRGSSDFLYPDIAHSTINRVQTQLLDEYSTAGLIQLNSIRNSNLRLLDLCFVSQDISQHTIVSEAPAPLVKKCRHHPPIQLFINELVPYKFIPVNEETRYNFRKTDFIKMNLFLSSIDWENLLQDLSVETTVEVFTFIVTFAIDKFTPKITRKNPAYPPWSNRYLKRLKSAKRTALKKLSKYPNCYIREYYLTCNSRYKRMNKQLFYTYLHRIQNNLKYNPKQFWAYVDEQRKQTGLPTTMRLGDKEASSLPIISDLFKQHFSEVFNNDTLSPQQVTDAAANVPPRLAIGPHPRISHSTVELACSRMKCSLNPGPDGIPSIILKNCSLAISQPLATIFNRSLSSGCFPKTWKKSFVFPVYKKGDKREVSNYRAIAALSATSKLFELLVLDFLKHHCLNYISTTQHGFMPKRSTSTNLTTYTSFVIKTIEAHKQVDAIYTDFSAAFDKINHEILLAKLDQLGFSGSLLAWLNSYLVGRSMSVKIGNAISAPVRVTSGVPQGSHIGPFLFLLYLNDVNLVLNCFKLSYADDFKLYNVIISQADAQFLQQELDIFCKWCATNRMSLNANKCSVISFGRKRSTISFNYTIAGTSLKRESTVKDLGVLLDSQLTFKEHVGYITAKASKCLGFIFRATKEFSDIHCIKTLYCSLVRSTLEYAVVVWAPYYLNSIQKLEAIQHKFIRFALRRLPWNDPYNLPRYEDRCKLIDLDLLENRRIVIKASFVSDILQSHIDCPTVLRELHLDIRRRTLRSHQIIRIATFRTNYGYNEPISSMCRVFNRCYPVFDFHLSRSNNKNRFRELLSESNE